MPLTQIEISASALRHNAGAFRRWLAQHRGETLTAVVKGNAYGHGVEAVVSVIDPLVDRYQVDDVEELRELRALTEKPILVYGYVGRQDLAEAVALGGILSVYDVPRLEALGRLGRDVAVHLKLDALLGREGVLPGDLDAILSCAAAHPLVMVEEVYAHYANLEDTTDLVHAQAQTELYAEMVACVRQRLGPQVRAHITATSGALALPQELSGGSMRLGIGLYGLYPSPAMARAFAELDLQSALRWTTRLGQVKVLPAGHPVGYGLTYRTPRPMTVGMVPLGYSDGVDRGLSNVGEVLVRGVRCPMIGRVAMNMFAIDLTLAPDAAPEDEVVLLGNQGRERISAEEIAAQLGTIPYEVLARISPRLSRVLV